MEKCTQIYIGAQIFMGTHKTKNKSNNILGMMIIVWILNPCRKIVKTLMAEYFF